MMKKVLLISAAMLLLAATRAQSYDFSAVTPSGQTLYYAIYDASRVYVVGENAVGHFSSTPAYSNLTGSLTIPPSVSYGGSTYSVAGINDRAFSSCNGLTSVTIPNTVSYIGEESFYGCSSLTGTLTILANDTYYVAIGDYAFNGCELTSVVINYDAVASIGEGAFSYCTSMTSVSIPSSVTQIGEYAFSGCWDLNAVYYTGSLEGWCGIIFGNSSANPLSSANNLYINNSLVTNLTIPSSVTQIGSYIFAGAECLTSLTIPNTVTSIGQYAFYGCSGLTSLSLPNSVTSIGHSAFSGCSGVCYVTIPNSVTFVGGSSFEDVGAVIDINGIAGSCGADQILSYSPYFDDYMIYENASKTSLLRCCKSAEGAITIPSTVTSISAKCFKGCDGITSVNIPNSVTRIENETFEYCSNLTSVTIGSSVTSIGEEAFSLCRALAEIHSLNPVAPTLGTDAFYHVTSTIPVYVPCGSLMIYYARWQYFSNFIEDCDGIDDVKAKDVKVYAFGSEIMVEGCYGEEAMVYDMTGREVYRGRVDGSIHVNALGVYMVKVGNRSAQKVVVL